MLQVTTKLSPSECRLFFPFFVCILCSYVFAWRYYTVLSELIEYYTVKLVLIFFFFFHHIGFITDREPALSLGVAFQLTNILRDVGEDAKDRGRVYLPREDMDRFGVTDEQLFEQRVDENYINMMKFQIARAKMYYERARRGVFMLAEESRLPVQSSLDAYGKILDKIEENGYDTLTTRAYVGKMEKMSIIPFSWYRTQDISRTIPLPGDKTIPTLEEPSL